jgi:hypothetical protein
MRELAPPKMVIPVILLFQSIVVEYAREYVIVEPIGRHVLHRVFWELGSWRRWR